MNRTATGAIMAAFLSASILPGASPAYASSRVPASRRAPAPSPAAPAPGNLSLPSSPDSLQQLVRQDPNDPGLWIALANLRLSEKKWDDAIDAATHAVQLDGSTGRNHYTLARTYGAKAVNCGPLKAIGAARACKREYETAVAMNPADGQARLELIQFLLQAPGIVGGDEDEALRQVKVLEGTDPILAASGLALYWSKKNEPGKAEETMRRAIDRDTSSTQQARLNLGYLFQREKEYARAESTYVDILQRKPDYPMALYQLGRTDLSAQTHLDEAEKCFRRCLELPRVPNLPPVAAIHWRLGMVLRLAGKRDAALAELREAVRLDPESSDYVKSLKEATGE